MGLTPLQMILAALAAFLVGFTKTGVAGLGILIVPLMAGLEIFTAKESTGALLPMLLFADLFAVARYRRHADWRILGKLLPWILPGILLGCLALKTTPEKRMYPVLAVLILLMVALNLAQKRGGAWIEERVPHQWWFSAAIGILAGFTTMLGNIAGPIMSVYLLSMGLPKREFMGTGAWYYLIVNAVKVPFSAGLGLISAKSLAFNLTSAPLIVIGAVVGILVFARIPQKWFDRAVVVLAAAAAVRLLLV